MGKRIAAKSGLECRVVDLARRAGPLVRPMGLVRIPAGPVGLRISSGDWVVAPAEDDPHLQSRQFVMPQEVIERLEALESAKVLFDRLYVAHEVPAATLRHSSKGAVTLDQKALGEVIPAPSPHPKTLSTLGVCTRITEATALALLLPLAALAMAPAAAAGAAAVLDPALLGAVTASGRAEPGELAAWFLVAAWT